MKSTTQSDFEIEPKVVGVTYVCRFKSPCVTDNYHKNMDNEETLIPIPETEEMRNNPITTKDDVTAVLKKYLDDLKSDHCWKSLWPLAEQLLDRKCEMQSVCEDIARNELSRQQCHSLWQQILYAGKFSSTNVISDQKLDHAQLKELNQTIRKKAAELAEMLTKREAILNRNSFLQDHTTHIVELMEKADDNEGLYRANLHEKVNALADKFLIQYWPTLPGILQVVADEFEEIGFKHGNDREIIHGRGKILPDYLRRLFGYIEDLREGPWGLPKGFTLTDKSLATLAEITLKLTNTVDIDTIKVRRNELYKKGTRGAWRSKKPPQITK